MNKVRAVMLALALTAGVLVFGIYWIAKPRLWPSGGQTVMVKIPKGSTPRRIAEILHDEKAVRSPVFFLVLARISGKMSKLRHGTYQLDRDCYRQILAKISAGETYRTKVTLPEGWSAYQMGEKLENEGIISDRETFFQWARKGGHEGMLFPETYFFETDLSSESAGRMLLNAFEQKFDGRLENRARELKMTRREAVTLASIIEREAQIDAERAVISSVYHNRLKKKWPLEADPTVQYAIGEGKFWKDRITYADLKIDSAYNTYRRRGLPPGPICNPGVKSLEAALFPADTPYLYFVADGKGAHFFFQRLEEHILKKNELKRAKRLSLQKRAAQ